MVVGQINNIFLFWYENIFRKIDFVCKLQSDVLVAFLQFCKLGRTWYLFEVVEEKFSVGNFKFFFLLSLNHSLKLKV